MKRTISQLFCIIEEGSNTEIAAVSRSKWFGAWYPIVCCCGSPIRLVFPNQKKTGLGKRAHSECQAN